MIPSSLDLSQLLSHKPLFSTDLVPSGVAYYCFTVNVDILLFIPSLVFPGLIWGTGERTWSLVVILEATGTALKL